MIKKIGIVGLGNVGEAVVRSLRKHSSLIRRRTGLILQIKGVCDKDKSKRKIARKYSVPFVSNVSKLIKDPQIDIIVELIGGMEPANSIIEESLRAGKHVVTANKALLATKGRSIFSLAKKETRTIGFESSVCGAIPLIRSISNGLVGSEVKSIHGILNGTTNYILDKMQKEKLDFSSALKEAKLKGLAEEKPRLDIEGIDTLHKLCILSYLCFGVWPSLKKVYSDGIGKISLLDVLYSAELEFKIKLLAIAKKDKNSLDLRVHPTLIRSDHPLADVSLAYNAVYLDTQPAGQLLFYGEGAGGLPASSSVISDIVNIALNEKGVLRREQKVSLVNIKNLRSRYYIRFMAQDKPGVLAMISKILASLKISIASVTQKERGRDRFVPIIMITHEAKEDNLRRAISKIDKLSAIKSPSQIIRIENL